MHMFYKKMNEQNYQKPSSTNEIDPSTNEKRLCFRLNDNCSVGNIGESLEGVEGISESAASTGNSSVASSCDDLV